MENTSNKKRIITFDILRIVAAFAVIWLHTSAQHFYDSFPSNEWTIRNIYDSLVRWAVPIFIMISGALFLELSKQLSIKRLYSKNVTRIIIAYLLWSFIYTIYEIDSKASMGYFVIRVLEGPFHFWFLKMLIGLYIATPILRAIVANKIVQKYFICIAIITAYILPQCFELLQQFNNTAFGIMNKSYQELNFHITLGYVGYFVIGHYLYTYGLSRFSKMIFYVLGCVSFPIVILLTYWYSHRTGAPYTSFYSNLNLFTLSEAVALFLFIKGIKAPVICYPFLLHASKMSFGIYLIHIMVMRLLYNNLGVDSASFNPVFSIPFLSIAVFAISYFIISLLNRVPYLNKYLM